MFYSHKFVFELSYLYGKQNPDCGGSKDYDNPDDPWREQIFSTLKHILDAV